MTPDEFASANARYLKGLKDIEGTFTGTLDMTTGEIFITAASENTPITIWAARDDLPLWRHWIALFRERFFGTPYPQVAVLRGYISGIVTTTSDEAITVTGSLKK